MSRELTERQQKFLAVLFDEAGGDVVAAKKIASTDVSRVVPRRNWTTGTVYDYYRHDYGQYIKGSSSSLVTADSGATQLFDATFYVYPQTIMYIKF